LQKKYSLGVVDVGGGLRGIYGSGVFDFCLDHGIAFDYCIGVSAGAANIGSYLSRQRGRNYRFFHEYTLRRRYMSIRNKFALGNYMDNSYLYDDIARHDGEDPYDFKTAVSSGIPMVCVATNALTGRPVYLTPADMSQDHYTAFLASCNIPVLNRPYMYRDIPCFDGGISDPLPIRKAFRDGCERVVVILTLPEDRLLDPRKDVLGARLLRSTYPQAAACILHRSQRYNRQLMQTKAIAASGRALIVAPSSTHGLKTLTKDAKALDELYRMGYEDASAIQAYL
jgi:predicted patatin/cPLA2 family phospholipase